MQPAAIIIFVVLGIWIISTLLAMFGALSKTAKSNGKFNLKNFKNALDKPPTND